MEHLISWNIKRDVHDKIFLKRVLIIIFVIAMLRVGRIILPRCSEWTNPRHNNHLHLQGLSLIFNKDE